MKFIIGEKKEMTQFFDATGTVHPATRIFVGKVVVTQIKTLENDGYTAVQVGFGVQKKDRMKKPFIGHIKDLGDFKYVKEFRVSPEEIDSYKVGDEILLENFIAGDMITVSGISKGKGFQGGVKRHGFHGGRRSHGQKHSEREPGSIGAGGIQRVLKGTRMAGRMGGDRITVKNLKVLSIDSASGELLLGGPVPGRRGTLLEITATA